MGKIEHTDLLSIVDYCTKLSIQAHSGDKNSNAFLWYELGATIAAPLLIPYVHWILTDAKQQNISNLYFLARDGQLLKLIAERLTQRRSIEIRYLYGSRQAWHLPSVTEIANRELNWITQPNFGLNITGIATRINIDNAFLANKLNSLLGRCFTTEEVLSTVDLRAIRGCLAHPSIAALVIEQAKQARESLLAYLSENDFLKNSRVGIVDLGWHGNMQRSLQKAISMSMYTTEVVGWYFGLLSNSHAGHINTRSFFFTPYNNLDYGLNGLINFLEIFCTADHGTTLGYFKDGNKHAPIISQRSIINTCSMDITAFRSGIFEFATIYDRNCKINLHSADFEYIKEMNFRLNTLRKAPNLKLADALGRYMFSSDQAETRFVEFAPIITIKECLNSLTKEPFNTHWLHGSLVRSALPCILVYSLVTLNPKFFLMAIKVRFPTIAYRIGSALIKILKG